MSIYKYYLKASSLDVINDVLLNTLGAVQSTNKYTIVHVDEHLAIIDDTGDTPIFAEPTGSIFVNVYSINPIQWPNAITVESPVTPWSDLL